MVGAIIELVTNRNAPQSYWLIDKPQITFFKFVLRRHTNYSRESIAVPFSGPVTFGSKLQAVLPRKGDLVHQIIFQAEIDPIQVIYPNTRTQDLANLIENSPLTRNLLRYFEPDHSLADLFPALDQLSKDHQSTLKNLEETIRRLKSFQILSGSAGLEELADHLIVDEKRGTFHLLKLLQTQWQDSITIYQPPKPLSSNHNTELYQLLRQTTPLVFFRKLRASQKIDLRNPISLDYSGPLLLDTNHWNQLLARAPSHRQELEAMMQTTAIELEILFEKHRQLFSSSRNLFFAGSLQASGMYSYLPPTDHNVLNLTLWFFYWVKMLTNLHSTCPAAESLLRSIEAEIDFQMHDAAYIVNDIFAQSVGGMASYYPGVIDESELVVSISFYRGHWPSIEEIFELITKLAGDSSVGRGFAEIRAYFENENEIEFETELGMIFEETWEQSLDQMRFYYSLEKINQRAQNMLYSQLPPPSPEQLYRLEPRRGSTSYLETPYRNRFGTMVNPVPSPFDPETIEISPGYYTRHFFQSVGQPILLPKPVRGSEELLDRSTTGNYHRFRADQVPEQKITTTAIDLEFYPDDTLATALNRISRKNYGKEVIKPTNYPAAARALYWDYLQSSTEMKKIYQELVWWLGGEPFLAVADLIDEINDLIDSIKNKREALLRQDGLATDIDDLPPWLHHYLLIAMDYPPTMIDQFVQGETISEVLQSLIYGLANIKKRPDTQSHQEYLKQLADELDQEKVNLKDKLQQLDDLQYRVAQIMIRTEDAPSAWIEKLGHYLVENVRYQMSDNGENPTRSELSYGSDWMEVRSQLTLDPGKADGYHRMIGHLPELYQYRTTVKPAISINLPLIFHFNNQIAQSLPIISSSHTQHLIEINLRHLSELFYHDENARLLKSPTIKARLMVDYIYLEAPERRRFSMGITEYLIEEIQSDIHSLQPGLDQTINLNFAHPARGLITLIRPSEHLNRITNRDYFPGEKQWNNYALYPRYSHQRLRNHIMRTYRKLLDRLHLTDRRFGLIRLIDSLVSGSENAAAWHSLKRKLIDDEIPLPKTESIFEGWATVLKMSDSYRICWTGRAKALPAMSDPAGICWTGGASERELSWALIQALDEYDSQPIDYQGLLDLHPLVNPAAKITHLAESHPITPEIGSIYQDTIQPYYRSLIAPAVGVNGYFWSLKPFGLQSTGTLNLSYVEDFETKILLEEELTGDIISLLIGTDLLRCFSGFVSIGW